ncbi:restriction endonuclease subunit S [Amphritea opalescens]|nr:restriction endonuclease subunit S [Amphritea opalescens]
MSSIITDNIDIWTSAIKTRSSVGRGSSKKLDLYGIKKLRELILELAVRGKLVPQDPNDEPASVLLERIAAEKAQLVKEKKIKKPKALPEIGEDEKPFTLPVGWEWARLGAVGYTQTGGTPKKNHSEYFGVDIPFIKPADIQVSGIKYDNEGLSHAGETALGRTAPEGSILMVCIGTIGKCYYIDRPCTFNQQINSITPFVDITAFLFNTLSANYFQRAAWALSSSTTIAIINKGKWESLPVPLAPLSEQHRIVAKVDELMALCDQLEQQTETSIEAHATLVETLLATLTNSADAAELEQNWTRLAGHFDTLFTTEQSIDQLKQTVLQLAVMGKLVPQDPNDEPAAVLLEKIAAEKAQLIKDKKIKKQKPLPPIGEDEKPFPLPEGWEWVRFSLLSNEVATGPFGSMINKREYIDGGVPLINPSHMVDSKIYEDSSISVTKEKAQELDSYKIKKGDIVMARRGEMGRCALVTEREHLWLCGTGSFVLRFSETISRPYILLLFRTSWIKEYLGGKSIGTTMVNLNHGILNKMPLLLPPVAEQHRIVAKVDQLMALCDQLKTRLQQAQQTQLHLADALVDSAIEA